ncbi:hypothetical protein DFA_00194 [Cavenderia fasciculata]|uniref:Uncharacterized protein n=1 Tax=Cavenderia fasciculata TaxID=261658 RepID=F4PXV6_CACFS|nr:uncharacterized protein DFA_00194 [Cavenderia fasciculata]EGG19616.1 hypothetical protein DFA_00194 [Cavenderia fasciculata]|eukprot:XP_004357910.1 hypothetical protein DFA_00194 [Cavenderia fasciculata]
MTLQFLGRQKNKNDEKVKIDETLFRRVWNNKVLQRLICSKIKDYLSTKDRAALIRSGAASNIEMYKADITQFIRSNYGSLVAIFYCEFLTVDLFKLHFDTYCKETSISEVMDAFSHNNRHSRDTWLFRRVIDILKDRGIKPESMSTVNTWRHVIESNNVDLYNYVKSVLPMPTRESIKKDLVPRAAMPYSWNKTIYPLTGTDVLAELLQDLIDLDPTENWLECVDFSYLALMEKVDILETIAMYAMPCIPYLAKPYSQYSLGRQLNERTMMLVIQRKRIESIKCLYKSFKIPLSHKALMAAARTCDLPFIIALNNIEPAAGRLYTIFLLAISSKFNVYLHADDFRCENFREAFINHVKPLNYIHKRLQRQINNNYVDLRQWPRLDYQPTYIQQHFAMFQQQSSDDTNIPLLSFDDI